VVEDVVFRYENKAVAQKVHLKRGGMPPTFYAQDSENLCQVESEPEPDQASQSEDVSRFPDCTTDLNATPLGHMPAWPSEALALGHLMNHHGPGSCFEYLENQWAIKCPAFNSAVTAAALANFYITRRRQDTLLHTARLRYADALGDINKGLRCPDTARHDSTLIAVLCLGLFEALLHRVGACVDSATEMPASWMAHMMGSLSLVRLRGRSQFDTPLGRQLFVQVTTYIRFSCNQRKVTVPNEVIAMHKAYFAEKGGRHEEAEDVVMQTGLLMDRMARLRVELASIMLRGDVLSAHRREQLIAQLDELDAEFACMLALPQNKSKQASDWNSHPVQARRWRSALQMMRLSLARSIWSLLSQPCSGEDIADELHREALRSRTSVISHDILSTASQYLDEQGRFSLPRARYLIWPLASVAASAVASRSARDKALGYLRRIGHEGCNLQALDAAQTCEAASDEDWMHMYHLT
jgi:hypothetical protein